MEVRRIVSLHSLLVIGSLVGCAAVDPQVGSSQESCGVDAAGRAPAAGSTGYGASNGQGAPQAVASQICRPDAGSACDDCESTFCCTTRMACYTDPVCVCADQALDECFDTAEKAGADSSAHTTACWEAFTARGTVEQARVACQRTWCGAVCVTP